MDSWGGEDTAGSQDSPILVMNGSENAGAFPNYFILARMVESADTTDLKSVGELNPCASSSLAPGTIEFFFDFFCGKAGLGGGPVRSF